MFASYDAFCGTFPISGSFDLAAIAGFLALASAYALGMFMVDASGPLVERMAGPIVQCITWLALISPLLYVGLAFL
jgi:hypothetical protein